MIKKYLILIMLVLSAAICLLPQASATTGYSLVEHQIAAVLMNEARGGGEKAMSHVAGVIQYRMQEQHVLFKDKAKNLTYTDIVFKQNAFEGADKFKNKTSDALENYWIGTKEYGIENAWKTALGLAHKVVTKAPLPYVIQGANSFNQSHKNGALYSEKFSNGNTHYFFYAYPGLMKHNPKLMTDDTQAHDFADTNLEIPEAPSGGGAERTYKDPENVPQHGSMDSMAEAAACSFENMKQIYMDETDNANLCWYCNVVIVLMNSFFKGAKLALPTMQTLGHLILRLGFLIWLAIYILQQVSSFTPITPGKMLQEILNMGFKVALAYAFVNKGGEAIAYYFINPTLNIGIDYGLALFKGLSANSFS